jgi:Protein of unknown function (DUF1360)
MDGSSKTRTGKGHGLARLRQSAQRQRQEYTGAAERPLGAYLAAMGIYGGLVAALAGAAKASGRELPERVEPWDLVVVTLATHKLSRLVSKDKVTSPLRAPFMAYQGRSADKEVKEKPRGSGMREAVGELVGCPFCLGMWVATGFSAGLVFAPRLTRLGASTLAILTGSDFLQYGYAAVQQCTP